MSAAETRFQFAEALINIEDFWLARHFLLTALATAQFAAREESSEFQAKLHCFLAFIGRKNLGNK